MNIIVPMAGRGKRVIDHYKVPKPLTKIRDKYLVELATKSLNLPGQYIFILRKFNEFGELNTYYDDMLYDILINNFPSAKMIITNFVTDGPASSVLLAEDLINNNESLLVSNCDQYLKWNANDFLRHIYSTDCDGCVTTYPHSDIVVGEKSKYSFVELKNNWAIKFEEKFAISDKALNGTHYWKKGSDCVKSIKQMIDANDRCNDEFYISKSYNYLLDKRINIYPLKKEEYCSLGTIDEIEGFLNEVDR